MFLPLVQKAANTKANRLRALDVTIRRHLTTSAQRLFLHHLRALLTVRFTRKRNDSRLLCCKLLSCRLLQSPVALLYAPERRSPSSSASSG